MLIIHLLQLSNKLVLIYIIYTLLLLYIHYYYNNKFILFTLITSNLGNSHIINASVS